MGAPQYEQAGADIGGTGTTNTIPRWTGPSTLGDSVITQSGSNIGIGTASPSFKLEVAAGTASAMRLVSDSGTATVLRLLQTANRDWGIRIPASSTSLSFYDYSAGQERMVIDLNGNVGIGTASPGASLHVLSTGANPFILASTQTTTYLDIRTSTSTSVGYVGTGGMVVGGAANDLALRAVPAGSNVIIAGPGGALRGTFGSTALDVSHVSGYGLKLPATPGNADTQTLDCYQEGTWVPTLAGFGGTNPTVTATLTRVGRLVTLTVQMQSTGGAQYSGTLGATTLTVPAGMTPNIPACTNLVNGAVQNLGNVAAYNDGLIYLPTFALTTAFTFFVVTYRV